MKKNRLTKALRCKRDELHSTKLTSNKKALISFGVAKILVAVALGSAYLNFRFLGIPFFILSAICLVYSVVKCLTKMNFAPLIYVSVHDYLNRSDSNHTDIMQHHLYDHINNKES